MIKSVIWSSMLDYPGHICTTLFFNGCNFNCEYCYNKSLVELNEINFEKEILPKLLKRKDMVNHIILSGGECTISTDFQLILDVLHDNGFTMGIHTNGSQTDVILKNINKLSYIGMDIKSDFANYKQVSKSDVKTETISQTIKIIKESNIDYEFRTTIYPNQITKQNCINIAKMLKENGISHYSLQNYKEVKGINVKSLAESEIEEIRQECNKILITIIKNI